MLADVTAAYLLNAQARQRAQVATDWLRDGSLRDALTGLPNRVLLRELIEQASRRSRRNHGSVAVLFVDLDHFARVNEAHGHMIGDRLLVAVARRLSLLVRPGDTLARISGDQFVFLCEDLPVPADVDVLIGRIDEAFAERSCWRPSRSPRRRAWASRSAAPVRRSPTTWCSMRTSRCTRPSAAAARPTR